MIQNGVERLAINNAQNANDTDLASLFEGNAISSPSGEDRRKEQGEDESAGESESVGNGHGLEDLAGDAFHREKRDEGDEDDQCREQDWARGFRGSVGDNVEAGIFGLAVLQAA